MTGEPELVRVRVTGSGAGCRATLAAIAGAVTLVNVVGPYPNQKAPVVRFYALAESPWKALR